MSPTWVAARHALGPPLAVGSWVRSRGARLKLALLLECRHPKRQFHPLQHNTQPRNDSF